MKPRKKSSSVIYIVVFIMVVYCGLHLAMAYKWAEDNPSVDIRYEGTPNETRVEKLDWLGLLEEWGRTLSDEPFDIKFNEHTAKILIIVSAIYLLIVAYISTNKRKYIAGMEHGSAEWGDRNQLNSLSWQNTRPQLIKETKKELKRVIKVLNKDKKITSFERNRLIEEKKAKAEKKIEYYKNSNMENTEIVLAEGVKFSMYSRKISNNNVIVYGGSGSRKSRGPVMTNILNLAGHCSFVITDPKGEVYEKSRYFLQMMGYKVRCLNLFEKYKTSHYNPMYYIHVDREKYDWQEDVLTLIDTMIINLDGGEGKKSSDPFWDDSARHFIQSLFFFVMYMYEPEDRNMNQVMWLLDQLEIGEEEDDYDCPLDQLFELLKNTHGEDNIAYRTYKAFRTKASGKTAKSIAMTMVSKLQPYNIASVEALSEYDELMLDRIGEEKTALFVIVPPVSKTFNFIAGMMFQQTFSELNYCANALHGGRLPVPVQFILDEFANTCIIPGFEQIIAYARSLGINIMPILQARSQLKSMYEKAWETISDNCASTIFLGNINSEDTLEAFSKRIGEGTFDEKDVSVTKGRNSSTSISNKKIGRRLMTPDELATLDPDDCIIFVSGRRPMYCKKSDFSRHKNYQYTPDFDDRYLKMFKEESSPIRPHGEDELSVEDKVANVINSLQLPTMTTEPQEVLNMINDTYLGNWELESSYLTEDEISEIASDISIEEEQKEKKENAINITSGIDELWKDIENTLPTLTTSSQEVESLIDEMSNNIEEIEIVDVSDYELEDEDDIFLNDILSSAKDLSEEMSQVEQIQNVTVDLSSLSYANDDEEEDSESE